MQKLLFGLVFLCLSLLFATKIYAGGVAYQLIKTDQVTFGLWYPSGEQATQTRLGVYEVQEYAYKGKLANSDTLYPLVIVSHGRMGRYLNHRITAHFLAQQGFIVAMPQHTQDQKVASGKLQQALQSRIIEVNATFNAVIANEKFGKNIDQTQIHAIGYSLGTTTMLAASGIVVDINLIRQYCLEEGEQDPYYCDLDKLGVLGKVSVGMTKVLSKGVKSVLAYSHATPGEKKRQIDLSKNAFPFQKIVLIAPTGKGYTHDALQKIKQNVLVVAMRDDKITPVRFHAEKLKSLLPQSKINYQELVGNHYAFIGPFPKWLLAEQEIPAAEDLPGFDRLQVIDHINQMILAYLRS